MWNVIRIMSMKKSIDVELPVKVLRGSRPALSGTLSGGSCRIYLFQLHSKIQFPPMKDSEPAASFPYMIKNRGAKTLNPYRHRATQKKTALKVTKCANIESFRSTSTGAETVSKSKIKYSSGGSQKIMRLQESKKMERLV